MILQPKLLYLLFTENKMSKINHKILGIWLVSGHNILPFFEIKKKRPNLNFVRNIYVTIERQGVLFSSGIQNLSDQNNLHIYAQPSDIFKQPLDFGFCDIIIPKLNAILQGNLDFGDFENKSYSYLELTFLKKTAKIPLLKIRSFRDTKNWYFYHLSDLQIKTLA